MLIFVILFVGVPSSFPSAAADSVTHANGNLSLRTLTDWGSIEQSVTYKGVNQQTNYPVIDYRAYSGLVFDRPEYNRVPAGLADFSDSGVWLDMGVKSPIPDFNVTASDTAISFEVNDAQMQKSYASFTQVDAGNTIGVSNDVRVHQTTWTLAGKDWAIIEWRIQNILGSDITGANVGFFFMFTDAGFSTSNYGPGGDGRDDIDFWDGTNSIYYVRDDNGTGVCLGISSADEGSPMNHYYAGQFMNPDFDSMLRNAMEAPSRLSGSVPPQPISALLGWNGNDIPTGLSMRFPVVIAYGADDVALAEAVQEARDFYRAYAFDVLITEVQDSPAPGRIEVFNDGTTTYDLSSWELRDINSAMIPGTWSADSNLPPAEYRYFDLISGTLGPEGDRISLFDGAGALKGALAYGQFGTAPDPLSGESSARYWNGQIYRSDWTRDPSPTFGDALPPWTDERNDVPPLEKASEVVLNEIYFNPTNPGDEFIELYYKGSGTQSINGYRIVCDSEYVIGPTVLTPANRHYTLRASSAPGFFAELTARGDNVYLYDSTGRLLDMAGWNTSHTMGTSMARVPEGQGLHNGFDDETSELAGWRFDQPTTLHLIDVSPDQTKYGDFTDVVPYQLVVENMQAVPDIVDVFADLPQGWQISFYDALNMNPLTDSNSNGLPDTGTIGIGSSRGITARVTVPSGLPVGNEGIAIVYGKGNADPLVGDTAVQTTRLYPHLELEVSAEPTTIYVEKAGRYGLNNLTTVTLDLTGAGFVVPGVAGPADVMFLIDDTGSMGDDIDHVKDNVNYFTDKLMENISDLRLGLVTYKDNVETDLDLTTDVQAFRNAINALVAADGGDYEEDVEGAIQRGASNQIAWRLTPDVTKVMILIGDAPPHNLKQACDNAANAKSNKDIITNTIATANGSGMPDAFMYIAENGTGVFKYIPQLNPEDPDEFPMAIIEGVLMHIAPIYVAGYDPDTSDAKPMLSMVLPGYLTYVPGTFRDPITSDPKDPDHILNPPAGLTLQWEIEEIKVRKSWSVSYEVTSSQAGVLPLHTIPDSRVTYTRWDDSERTDPMPEVFVNVLAPPIPTPFVQIEKDPNGKDIVLDWDVPPNSAVDNYLIYRSTSQTDFDFGNPWANTSSDVNPLSGQVDPLNRTWADVGATDPGHPNHAQEYYYVVRSENVLGMRSPTGNTVGFHMTDFEAGLNTFSLPIRPTSVQTLDALAQDMGADKISWIDANDDWQIYPSNPLAPSVEMGEGYVVEFSAQSSHVFTGEPAAMIMYQEGFGFDSATRDDIGASVDTSGDVTVTWTPIAGADGYHMLRATERDGFHTDDYTSFDIVSPPFLDAGAAGIPGEIYYMVVPYNFTEGDGSSTYSIGVITEEYNGNEMFGLPLKPVWGDMSADWYADQIPNCLGIVFLEDGIWKAHFKEFPEGVYDTTVEVGAGYELSVFVTSRYSFVGW